MYGYTDLVKQKKFMQDSVVAKDLKTIVKKIYIFRMLTSPPNILKGAEDRMLASKRPKGKAEFILD